MRGYDDAPGGPEDGARDFDLDREILDLHRPRPCSSWPFELQDRGFEGATRGADEILDTFFELFG